MINYNNYICTSIIYSKCLWETLIVAILEENSYLTINNEMKKRRNIIENNKPLPIQTYIKLIHNLLY